MARISKLTDETLKDYLSHGVSQAEIAKLCSVSESAISQRIKALEVRAAAKALPQVVRATENVWDTQTAIQASYQRTLELLNDDLISGVDKIKVHSEIRQHLSLAMSVLETLYSAKETENFMNEVMAILDECEPGSRDRILAKLTERRSLRAAFLPHH